MPNKCAVCGKDAKNVCGKCKKESYCSRECQISGWKTHKQYCGAKPKRVLPKSILFPSSEKDLLGFGEEDNVGVWCSIVRSADGNLIKEKDNKLLSLKVLVQNFGKLSAKLSSKSPLLTLKDKAVRQKVYTNNPQFIELNGKETNLSDALSQIVLEENQYGVMSIAFQFSEEQTEQEALQKCSFIEVPVKVDQKGVLKIKVNFQTQSSSS